MIGENMKLKPAEPQILSIWLRDKNNNELYSVVKIGNVYIYLNKKFNKFQKFMWKLCFNLEVEDYIPN